MATKENTKQNHLDIRKKYHELARTMEYGVRKYNDAWIVRKIAKQFYKSPKTIENIICHRV